MCGPNEVDLTAATGTERQVGAWTGGPLIAEDLSVPSGPPCSGQRRGQYRQLAAPSVRDRPALRQFIWCRASTVPSWVCCREGEINTVQEFVFHADLGEGITIGDGPVGSRIVIPVIGGWIKGERLNGAVVGPGETGQCSVARLCAARRARPVANRRGALVYVHYDGVLELNEATMAAFAGSTPTTATTTSYFASV